MDAQSRSAKRQLPPDALHTYRRLLGYLRPHRGTFAIGVSGMVLFAATDAGWAAFVKFFLDGTFIDKDPRMVWLVPVVLVGLFIVRGFADFLQNYFPGQVGRHIVKTLRTQIFDRYLNLPVTYFDRSSSGVMLSRLTFNTEQVATATTDSITIFIRDTLAIIGLIASRPRWATSRGSPRRRSRRRAWSGCSTPSSTRPGSSSRSPSTTAART